MYFNTLELDVKLPEVPCILDLQAFYAVSRLYKTSVLPKVCAIAWHSCYLYVCWLNLLTRTI